jgi:hypothetical protein
MRLIKSLRNELPDSPIVVRRGEFAADLHRSLFDSGDNAFLLTTGTPISWCDFGVVHVASSPPPRRVNCPSCG